MQKRIKNSLCITALVGLMLAGSYTYAKERWRPGGSPYFRQDVEFYMKKRDLLRDEVNTYIYKIAQGDHSKDLALRAAMYEYCRTKASDVLSEQGVQLKGIGEYQNYVYLQTQFYEYLQPTITKLRYVLDDPTISFETILQHLQSNDKEILYFYATLPKRYDDKVLLSSIDEVEKGLRGYYLANNSFPSTLDDLVEYRFLDDATLKKVKKDIAYMPHNIPQIISTNISYVQVVKPNISRYLMMVPVDYISNVEIYARDKNTLQVMMRTYALDTWNTIKKSSTPVGVGGQGWRIYLQTGGDNDWRSFISAADDN